jgi:hypothetical protein
MPYLISLEVDFNPCCLGLPLPAQRQEIDPPEPTITRIQTLKDVAKAMKRRYAGRNLTPIRELYLINLQNTPLPKNLTDELLEKIQHLHIIFIVEYQFPCESSSATRDERVYQSDMRDFPYYLPQLIEMTLSGWVWGAIPGEFNGKGLLFPRLKTLSLSGYIILRRDQFDWVLKQESLTSLTLHDCTITTHCLVLQPEFAVWGIDLRGWTRVADVPPHDDMAPERFFLDHEPQATDLEPGWYVNDLRWDSLFDSIRESLTMLQRFAFDWSGGDPSRTDEMMTDIADMPSKKQYFAFVHLIWARLTRPECFQGCDHVQEGMLGQPAMLLELAEPMDRQALDALL